MLVYLKDGSAQTIVRAATLRHKLQVKHSISPTHIILTPGQPVPALTSSDRSHNQLPCQPVLLQTARGGPGTVDRFVTCLGISAVQPHAPLSYPFPVFQFVVVVVVFWGGFFGGVVVVFWVFLRFRLPLFPLSFFYFTGSFTCIFSNIPLQLVPLPEVGM